MCIGRKISKHFKMLTSLFFSLTPLQFTKLFRIASIQIMNRMINLFCRFWAILHSAFEQPASVHVDFCRGDENHFKTLLIHAFNSQDEGRSNLSKIALLCFLNV